MSTPRSGWRFGSRAQQIEICAADRDHHLHLLCVSRSEAKRVALHRRVSDVDFVKASACSVIETPLFGACLGASTLRARFGVPEFAEVMLVRSVRGVRSDCNTLRCSALFPVALRVDHD
jgi:hypothetical protein